LVDFAGHHRQRREKEKAGQIRPFLALSAAARSKTVQAVPKGFPAISGVLGTVL
jgi:hypothetical protein